MGAYGRIVNRAQELLPHYNLIAKFIKFGFVGASGFVVDMGILFVLRNVLGLPELLSNAISFTCAASSNYFLNRIWTFRSHENNVGIEYVKFFAVSVVGLGISTLVLWLLGKALPVWYEDKWLFYILKIIAIVITTVWNFFGNMLFTFRKSVAAKD